MDNEYNKLHILPVEVSWLSSSREGQGVLSGYGNFETFPRKGIRQIWKLVDEIRRTRSRGWGSVEESGVIYAIPRRYLLAQPGGISSHKSSYLLLYWCHLF